MPDSRLVMLTADEVAGLLEISDRGVRDGCMRGRYVGAEKDRAGVWYIPLSALSVEVRARYLTQFAGVADAAQSQFSAGEREALHARFENATRKLKERAWRDAEACHYWQLNLEEGKSCRETATLVRDRFGIRQSALYDKLTRIRGYDPMDWPALLIGQWKGDGARRVRWPGEAWKFFLREALTPRCPVKTAWKRTRNEAARLGWGEVPSYDKAKRDFSALDHDVVTLIKEGETALKARTPTAQRDYTTLPLHDTWSMDGRRLDVMCVDRKGKYGPAGRVFRPWIYAYADVRSRYLLGYALGSRLDADLVRAAFLATIKNTGRIVPREIEPDNGMEIAAKENSGGTPWRRRGKVNDDEIIGLFPRLGIEIGWTQVAHGQAKIIERLFGTTARMLETRHEFRGAYCGNSPEARPEEWDAEKAIDIERLEVVLEKVVREYNEEPGHRGQGMDGKSPHLVYIEQSRAPGLALRQISSAQERICAYSATPITISKKDGSFIVLGARYWSEGSAKLQPGSGYYALYNPGNLSDAVYVYRAEKRLCEAQRMELTPYNDKAAAKDILRQRASYTRKVKDAARAIQDLIVAEGAGLAAQLPKLRAGEVLDTDTGEICVRQNLPKSAVRSLVPTRSDLLPSSAVPPTKDEEEMRRRIDQLERHEEQKAIDGLRKRATGRR